MHVSAKASASRQTRWHCYLNGAHCNPPPPGAHHCSPPLFAVAIPEKAVDQLVQCLTDDKYKGNMVVVVAGYAGDINELMEANPGLASRFPETLHFPNFGVDDCCRLLESGLKRGFSTDLAPDANAALRDLLAPLVQVQCVCIQVYLARLLVLVRVLVLTFVSRLLC